MTRPIIGRLERVNVRNVWQGEASEFTPWLAQEENIALLGETIALDLAFEAQEKGVGPFRADILCKDTTTGHYVLVENQLERTDHSHLGQLLTYAAGLDAVNIVWIANPFTDEHRAALDWLNRITNEAVNFFGLEVELWRIGDSAIAPKFNVVCQPNDWRKTVASAAAAGNTSTLTEFQQLHLLFWTQFRKYMEDRNSHVRMNKPSKDHWTPVAIGRTDFTVVAWNGMRDNRSGIYLSLTGPHSKAHFHLLKQRYQAAVQSALGPVEWREMPEYRESQIGVMRPSTPTNTSSWPELNDWFASNLERWVTVFRPMVRSLDAGEYAALSEHVPAGDGPSGENGDSR